MSLIVAKPFIGKAITFIGNSYPCNEQTYGLLNSFFQAVPFYIKCGNELMLPWYVEPMLLQHVFHLSMLHNVHQILHHTLKKYLKTCMLQHFLCYTKSLFQNN